MNEQTLHSASPQRLRLDLATGQLFADGKPVQLTPICFSMLSYFVQNPGRLITKQELLDNIWVEVFVEEGAVKGYVRKLRQVLNDDPKRPRYIEIARGLGYRYVGDIEVCGADQTQPASPAVPESSLIVAVLAFTNMSDDPRQEFFSDGITEDIITELSRFPMLSVIARHSSFAFKGEKIDIKEVGQKLSVDYLVEGSVRRVDDRVRITTQLVKVETERQIWAERYDRELEDIFAVQDDVTRAIVATIAAQLGKTISEGAARKSPTDVTSYEYLLQANRHYYRFNPHDNAETARLYKKALERDPQFARAYGGLANTYTTDHFLGWRRTENPLENGLRYAKKALALDSNDMLARAVLAWSLLGYGRWEEAELKCERMAAAKIGDADVMVEVGHALLVVGKSDWGIAMIEKAIQLNPLFPDSYRRWLGQGYFRAKRYQDAVSAFRAAPLEGWAHGCLAASLAYLGEREQAREAMNVFVTKKSTELEAAGAPASTTADLIGNYQDNFRHQEEWDHFLNGLRMAGLSD